MNIQENLQLLQQTKENIYQAINSKGGDIESGTPFSGYAQAILDLTGDTRPVLPEGVYEITVNCTGSTDGSESIGFYAALMTILPFDPEGVRYQDRYINVWTTAPASLQNPDYQIMFNYDTSTGEVGINQNEAYTSSPIYLKYGYDVKQMTDPADTGNTIWAAYFSARQTGTFYVQSVGLTYPIVGVNTIICGCDPCDSEGECYDQAQCDCLTDPCSDQDCPGYDPMVCGGEIDYSQYDWAIYLDYDSYFGNNTTMAVSDRNAHSMIAYYGAENGGAFDAIDMVPYGNYTIGLYDASQLYGDPPTLQDITTSFNGFNLSQSGGEWTIAATSTAMNEGVNIAVFDSNGNLKIVAGMMYVQ